MTDERLITQMANFERCVLERDRGLAETVLDADYALVCVQPSSAIMPRATWLDVLPQYVVHSWDVREQSIDVNGECAAALQRVDMTATVLGEDRNGLFVISDVWLRRDGDWRIWRRHSTPLTAGRMPGTS